MNPPQVRGDRSRRLIATDNIRGVHGHAQPPEIFITRPTSVQLLSECSSPTAADGVDREDDTVNVPGPRTDPVAIRRVADPPFEWILDRKRPHIDGHRPDRMVSVIETATSSSQLPPRGHADWTQTERPGKVRALPRATVARIVCTVHCPHSQVTRRAGPPRIRSPMWCGAPVRALHGHESEALFVTPLPESPPGLNVSQAGTGSGTCHEQARPGSIAAPRAHASTEGRR